MKTLLFCLCGIFLASCSYKVIRTGYKADKSASADCNIAIKKNAEINDSMEKLGEIRLKDSGFTVSCSEEDAIKLLQKEGCALNANLINIIDEQRFDIMSSCYRCTAEFYRVTGDSTVITDHQFSPEKVQVRSQRDKKRTTGIIIGSILGGIVAGVLVGLMSQ